MKKLTVVSLLFVTGVCFGETHIQGKALETVVPRQCAGKNKVGYFKLSLACKESSEWFRSLVENYGGIHEDGSAYFNLYEVMQNVSKYRFAKDTGTIWSECRTAKFDKKTFEVVYPNPAWKQLIPCRFDWAGPFIEAAFDADYIHADVRVGKKMGMIDLQGNLYSHP